jgi:hypothetical protein
VPFEVIVNQADIDGIAKKLDQFGAVLNDREKTVLLGVLGLAADGINKVAAAAPVAPPGGSGASSLPPLSAGFRNAFRKGVGSKIKIDSSQAESVEGGTTVSVGIGIGF